jgi:HPt (histidine-containing phosphotransfer) domain-containing protein
MKSALIISEMESPEMLDLVEQFVGELPGRAEAVCSAFARQDLKLVERLAHQLKGAAGGYGFAPISDIAADLERCVREQASPEDIGRQVRELADLCSRARAK